MSLAPATETGPCYGCGQDVPDDPEHAVYRYGLTLMCDGCRAEALSDAVQQAERTLGAIENVAAALRNLVEGKAIDRDRKTLEGWFAGNDDLMVGGEVDLEFLYGEQVRIGGGS